MDATPLLRAAAERGWPVVNLTRSIVQPAGIYVVTCDTCGFMACDANYPPDDHLPHYHANTQGQVVYVVCGVEIPIVSPL